MSPENASVGQVPEKLYRRKLANTANAAGSMLCVFDGDGKLVGSIRARPVSADAVEIGWFVAAEARGRGIATRVAAATVGWLADRGYVTFGARTLVSNAASVRVMEKLGFRPIEGHVAVGSDIDWVPMIASAGDVGLSAGPGFGRGA